MIEVRVEETAWQVTVRGVGGLAMAAAEAAVAARPDAAEGDLVVLLTDNAVIRDLNARFRDKDAATNVLSFPAGPNPHGHLGDVALAFGVCNTEAKAQGKSLAHHLQHLVAHGVLHLLGYDHQTDAEAETMEALERKIMADLGAPDPYAAEKDAPAGHD